MRSRFGAGGAGAFDASCCAPAWAQAADDKSIAADKAAIPYASKCCGRLRTWNILPLSKTFPSLLSHIHLQNASIAKHDFPLFISGKPDRRSVLGGGKRHCNLVSRLEGSLASNCSGAECPDFDFRSPN